MNEILEISKELEPIIFFRIFMITFIIVKAINFHNEISELKKEKSYMMMEVKVVKFLDASGEMMRLFLTGLRILAPLSIIISFILIYLGETVLTIDSVSSFGLDLSLAFFVLYVAHSTKKIHLTVDKLIAFFTTYKRREDKSSKAFLVFSELKDKRNHYKVSINGHEEMIVKYDKSELVKRSEECKK
jgi:hypothetical protein